MNFNKELQDHLKKIFLKKSFLSSSQEFGSSLDPAQKLLKKAILYSFKGKLSHFRPRLCFETAKSLGQKASQILPWAIALEMIHTGSLIHDDMPCMDDAKTRRAKKCNHLIFGEDIALLAGSCLFVESFSLLQDSLFDNKRNLFLELLIETTGFHGLMSGQSRDLKNNSSNKKELLKTMNLKTGSLISACVLGPALLWANKQEQKGLKLFAKHLGLAYQIADDYKDFSEDKKTSLTKKKELYQEGLFHLEKSLKALSGFKISGFKKRGLHSLVKEIRQKFSL